MLRIIDYSKEKQAPAAAFFGILYALHENFLDNILTLLIIENYIVCRISDKLIAFLKGNYAFSQWCPALFLNWKSK